MVFVLKFVTTYFLPVKEERQDSCIALLLGALAAHNTGLEFLDCFLASHTLALTIANHGHNVSFVHIVCCIKRRGMGTS